MKTLVITIQNQLMPQLHCMVLINRPIIGENVGVNFCGTKDYQNHLRFNVALSPLYISSWLYIF